MKDEFRQRVQYLLDEYPVWTRRTTAGHFDRAVEKYGERVLLYTPEQAYTYAWFHQRVELFARGLLALGIRPREHVAIVIGNYPEFIVAKLALAKIGAVAVALNTMLLERELFFQLEDSDAVAVIFNDRLGRQDFVQIMLAICPEAAQKPKDRSPRYPRLPKLRHLVCFSPAGKKYDYPGLIDFYALYELGEKIPVDQLKRVQAANAYPDDIFDIMYTSGTTTLPKGAMLSHDMSLRNIFSICVHRAIENGRRFYSPLPFYHIFAWNVLIMLSTFIGGSLITHPQFSPAEALWLMEKYKANEITCVPSILLAIINHPERQKYDLSSLRSVFCAATPAPLPLWKRAVEELKLMEIGTAYGLTEAGGAITLTFPGETLEIVATRVGELMAPNCSGVPEFAGRNVQVKIVDVETGEELPPGREGELLCRGNTVCRGYYKRPQLNAELIDKDGWLRTGDLLILHPDGYFQFTGRSKEIYKTSGENVIPREIEDIISTHPKVNQVYVVGVPHEIMGEVGVAFIELKAGESATRREIIGFCKDKLAKFKIPRYVFFVSGRELPFTATGKIQKFKLVEYAQKLLEEKTQENTEV
ncbi:MAG: AMP-binding protein [Armatimonadetes bacterium]|nr:AMP-binding protein [Armatimonadota bacterium]